MSTKTHRIYGREYRTADDIADRLAEIDKAHPGQRYPKSISDEVEGLHVTLGELDAERRRSAIRSAAANPRQREAGSGPDADRDDRREQIDEGDAYSRATRDTGLRAIERLDLSARAGDRLTDLIERDRSGQDARYIAAVASPEYERAFMRYITNPHSASMELDPKEAKAFREARVADEMRALSVGSGTLPIPASIDPTIRLTNNGQITRSANSRP